MKYMIIAGEASGDLHGSELITQLRHQDPDAKFVFLGGDLMAKAADKDPVVHYREMAYMGFTEVIRNLGKVRHNLKIARLILQKARPDCLILIDYPSFNLKVAETAYDLGIPVYYYISPKIWAWKEWRARTIRRVVRHMYVIFPFEVAYYKNRHQMDVTYVGNPSVEEIDRALAQAPALDEFCRLHKLRANRPIIALLPGSRKAEIRSNLQIMEVAAHRFVQYQAVVAGSPGIDPEFYREYTTLPVVQNDTMALLRHARAALVTSGTATLETALAGVPQVACYRSSGSRTVYRIMEKMLKVDFVTLPNLICGRRIIDELLMHQCTAEAVGNALAPLTRMDNEPRLRMLSDYQDMRRILGTDNAAANTARHIVNDLNNLKQAH